MKPFGLLVLAVLASLVAAGLVVRALSDADLPHLEFMGRTVFIAGVALFVCSVTGYGIRANHSL